ncbi:MAG: RagB/SusD family nutrient uptake outer membrane protein [Balneolales bacterium]
MKYINLFIILVFVFTACSDVLDQNPQDRYSDPVVWSDIGLIKSYLNRAYDQVEYGMGKGEMLGAMSDELVMARGGDNKPWNTGQIAPDRLGSNRGHLNWGHYDNVQRINMAISNMNDFEGAETDEIDILMGEALFLRAWTYHEMMRSYGGLILTEEPNDLNADYQDITRSTFEETINFIVNDADAAAEKLGFKSDMEMGRATKEAALALKSRVLLFAASELTAGPDVANELVGYTNPDRTALWTAARDAAKDVIDLGTARLSDFGAPDQAAVAENYHAFFETTDLSDDEIIWGRMFRKDVGRTHNQNRTSGPNGINNFGRNGPMQQMVESYQMEDGSDFRTHFTVNGNEEYELSSSVFTYENPYHSREPRFYGSILHDSARWQQRFPNLQSIDPVGIVDRRTRRVIENGEVVNERFGIDTRQGPVEDWNGNTGGYLLKKFMQRNSVGRDENNDNSWIFMRYAEVLLNYAEASLELDDVGTASTYINMVRNRAGLPNFTGDVMEALHYERKIELFAEDIRWYDIRRWRMLDEYLPKTPYGTAILEVTENGMTTTTWRRIRAMPDNNVVEKMYWIPIENDELQRAPQLQQNPGY